MFFSSQQQLKFIMTALVASLAFAPAAFAQGPTKAPAPKPAAPAAAPAPGAQAPSDDKIDVSDLENKYWAAKDTDFNVVQNRVYSKAHRFGLSGMYGSMVNDPWSEGQAYGGSLAYYFSDRYCIAAEYTMVDSKDNKAVKQLGGIQGAYPNNNKVKGYYGASFVWVPFYAKMSFLASTIIYFDMSFALGGGMQDYQQQRDDGNITKSTPALAFDITQHFFLSKYLAIRVDLKNRWYRDETAWYRTSSAVAAGSRTVSTDTDNTTLLMVGLTLLY
jgi:outer membrane beta-barrel protein